MTIVTMLEQPKVHFHRWDGKTNADVRRTVIGKTISPEARSYEPGTYRRLSAEITHATNVPETADLYHTNYLEYLETTWSRHLSIVMAPQHLWFTVLTEIAQVVIAAPDQYRDLFTDSPEQKRIIVGVAHPDDILPIDSVYAELVHLVPLDTAVFLPEFSTSTMASRAASLAAFLEAVSPYYSYGTLACGHPRVKVLGTVEDWRLMTDRLDAVAAIFANLNSVLVTWINHVIKPVVARITSSFDAPDAKFWSEIFSAQPCGSGSDIEISGWYSRLFVTPPQDTKPDNFPSQITRVPYDNIDTGRRYKLCFGLFSSKSDPDGFFVPEFSWVANELLTDAR